MVAKFLMVLQEKKQSFFKNKKEIVFLVISLIISIVFSIWQRRLFSWDFSVYVMNAESFFKGFYFEWLRPPLASFIVAIFLPLGRFIAVYSYTILVTLFYFFALKLFYNKFLRDYENSEFFYPIAINPFVLGLGLYVGTELLSSSLIILFLTFSFSALSFIFLALAMLTRHSNILLIPTILVPLKLKKILLGLLIILIVFSPWLLINYFGTGHISTSLGDYYALNSLEQPKPTLNLKFFFNDFLTVLNILIPLALLGIIWVIKKWKKLKDNEKTLIYTLIVLSILTLATYFFNSLKDPRFLFNLTFPAIYFSFFGLKFIFDKIKDKKFRNFIKLVSFLILILLSLTIFPITHEKGKSINSEFEKTQTIIEKLDNQNNCTVSSDLWVYFDWQGKKAVSAPLAFILPEYNESHLSLMTNEGYNIVLIKNQEAYQKNLPFILNLSNLDTLVKENNSDYIWIHNDSACMQQEKINSTFMDSMKLIGEFSQDFTGCDALATRLKLRKLCKIFPWL